MQVGIEIQVLGPLPVNRRQDYKEREREREKKEEKMMSNPFLGLFSVVQTIANQSAHNLSPASPV